jgi:hypothetical protein
MSSDELNFSQFISFMSAFIASLVTLQLLYTFTNQREVLVAAFVLVILVFAFFRKLVTSFFYPDRKDRKEELARRYLCSFITFVQGVAIVVLMLVIKDIFVIDGEDSQLELYDYALVILPVPIFFLFTFAILAQFI